MLLLETRFALDRRPHRRGEGRASPYAGTGAAELDIVSGSVAGAVVVLGGVVAAVVVAGGDVVVGATLVVTGGAAVGHCALSGPQRSIAQTATPGGHPSVVIPHSV